MKDATYITILLDRSGSMESIKDETITGFNYFLNEQKEAGDNCALTLVQFDSVGVDTVYENTPIKDVTELNTDTYRPRGGTPLLDALGDTIKQAGKVLKGIPESNRPDKVLFVILTDGHENASHRYSKTQIKEMINHQTDIYKWQFTYLGANQDAFAEARSIGVSAAMAANFVGAAVYDSIGATSSNVSKYRATGQAASLNYTDLQREKMMDDKTTITVKKKTRRR